MKKLIGFVIFVAFIVFACQDSNSILEPNAETDLEKNVEEIDSTNGSYKGKPILPRV
ncbi:MAG: hypothetical protein R3250_03775 [Melioribacteraceae bacterium]|nr:hypothetical protein [Melioribacteraceae bacterium]